MKVIRFKEAESYQLEEGWKRVSLCNEKNISVEYFIKPPGHASPMHEHPQEQVTIVIKGKIAVTSSKSGEVILEEGDVAFFSAHEPHMLKNCLNEPSIGIDIFHPARPFDFWLKRK